MSRSSTPVDVLIIGAGPGGLMLAHALDSMGISYEIYEREQVPGTAGWAVALIECLADMEEFLPKAVYDKIPTASVNHKFGCKDLFVPMDAKTGKPTVAVGENYRLIRTNRNRLRGVLREGIDVRMDKDFVRYEEMPDKTVVAHFKDGTTATGRLLVGTDGAHSRVRAQLIGNNRALIQSQQIAMAAEIDIGPELYKPIHNAGSAAIFGFAPNLRMLVGLLGAEDDLSLAHYYWVVCHRSDKPEEDSAWAQSATQQQLYDRSVELTQGLSPLFTDIIKESNASHMKCPPLRMVEYVPPEEGYTKHSTLATIIGDAAHTMIPFQLRGANSAIRDACDLARCLKRHRDDIPEALRALEQIMIPRGQDAVLQSRARGASGDLKEVGERVWMTPYPS